MNSIDWICPLALDNSSSWRDLPYARRMQQIARWTRYFYDLLP